MRRNAVVPAALAAWTLFVWGTRIRNIAEDGGGALSLVLAVGMVALGVVVAVAVWRGGRPAWALPALVAATVATWVVRVPLILAGDHDVAFELVHAALGVGSVLLAVAAWRSGAAVARGRRPVLSRTA